MNIIDYLRIKAAALPGRAMNADPTLRAGIDKAYSDISQPQYPQSQQVPVQQQRVTQQPVQQQQPLQQQAVPMQQPVQRQPANSIANAAKLYKGLADNYDRYMQHSNPAFERIAQRRSTMIVDQIWNAAKNNKNLTLDDAMQQAGIDPNTSLGQYVQKRLQMMGGDNLGQSAQEAVAIGKQTEVDQPAPAAPATSTTTTTTSTPEPAAQPEPVAGPAPSTNTATPPSAGTPSTTNPTPAAPGYRKSVGSLTNPAVKQTLQKGNVGTGHPLYEKAVSAMQQQIADTEKKLASLPQTDSKKIADLKKVLRLRKNKLLVMQKYGITPAGEDGYTWGGYLDGDEAYPE